MFARHGTGILKTVRRDRQTNTENNKFSTESECKGSGEAYPIVLSVRRFGNSKWRSAERHFLTLRTFWTKPTDNSITYIAEEALVTT